MRTARVAAPALAVALLGCSSEPARIDSDPGAQLDASRFDADPRVEAGPTDGPGGDAAIGDSHADLLDAAIDSPPLATCGPGRTFDAQSVGAPHVVAVQQFSPTWIATSGESVYWQTSRSGPMAQGGCALGPPGSCGGGRGDTLVFLRPDGTTVERNAESWMTFALDAPGAVGASRSSGYLSRIGDVGADGGVDSVSWNGIGGAVAVDATNVYWRRSREQCLDFGLLGLPGPFGMNYWYGCRRSVVRTTLAQAPKNALADLAQTTLLADVGVVDDAATDGVELFWGEAGEIRAVVVGVGKSATLVDLPDVRDQPADAGPDATSDAAPERDEAGDSSTTDAAETGGSSDAGDAAGAGAADATSTPLQAPRIVANGLSGALRLVIDGEYIYAVASGDPSADAGPSKGAVVRVRKAGGPIEHLFDGGSPLAVAVDVAHVYFAVRDADCGSVLRIPKSGGPVEVIAIDQPAIARVAVSDTGIFWTNALPGTVLVGPHGEDDPRGFVMSAAK